MILSGATTIFLISLIAIPATYSTNLLMTTSQPWLVFVSGTFWLLLVTALSYYGACDNKGQPRKSLYYMLGIFAFASVVDLIIGLENDGFIEGFMKFYLKNGEPYLKTAHGTMICYWDGIAHYAMYLMILSAISWSQCYREVALYWIGSIGHSMIILLLGSILGSLISNLGIKWSFLLNIPYLIIPFCWGAKLLSQTKEESISEEQVRTYHKSIWRRPLDLFFILYYVLAGVVALVRGLAVLDCDWNITRTYIEDYEPYIKDPTAYAKVQMLVYLFYFLPYYCLSLYSLLYPGNRGMIDWSLVHAGAAAQAQFSYIGGALHYRTPFILRVPQDSSVRAVFWITNLLLLVMPQWISYRCVHSPEFFLSEERKSSNTLKKD